jgi:hypothetical protein
MADDSGGVDVGGDGSVAWKVWAGNTRKGSVVSRWVTPYQYVDSGVDETPEGQNFDIGLKIPRENGEALARALAEAAKDAEAHAKEPGYRVRFALVIEPKNEDQITIRWQSTPAPETKLGLLATLKKKLMKKKGPKPAAKKKAAPKKPAPKKPASKGKKAGRRR